MLPLKIMLLSPTRAIVMPQKQALNMTMYSLTTWLWPVISYMFRVMGSQMILLPTQNTKLRHFGYATWWILLLVIEWQDVLMRDSGLKWKKNTGTNWMRTRSKIMLHTVVSPVCWPTKKDGFQHNQVISRTWRFTEITKGLNFILLAMLSSQIFSLLIIRSTVMVLGIRASTLKTHALLDCLAMPNSAWEILALVLTQVSVRRTIPFWTVANKLIWRMSNSITLIVIPKRSFGIMMTVFIMMTWVIHSWRPILPLQVLPANQINQHLIAKTLMCLWKT